MSRKTVSILIAGSLGVITTSVFNGLAAVRPDLALSVVAFGVSALGLSVLFYLLRPEDR